MAFFFEGRLPDSQAAADLRNAISNLTSHDLILHDFCALEIMKIK